MTADEWGDGSHPADLERAVRALMAGQVVAIPTDTVYGLAVDPCRAGAMGALLELKGRPAAQAVAVLVADLDQAQSLAADEQRAGLPARGRRLAERFWPGALTLVVARRPGLGWDLGGDESTIGLRCPADDKARKLCAMVGPLATTSANRHGEAPLHTAAAVEEAFGTGLVVVDGGRCDAAPSTVVDLTGETMRLLRLGGISFDEVLAAAG